MKVLQRCSVALLLCYLFGSVFADVYFVKPKKVTVSPDKREVTVRLDRNDSVIALDDDYYKSKNKRVRKIKLSDFANQYNSKRRIYANFQFRSDNPNLTVPPRTLSLSQAVYKPETHEIRFRVNDPSKFINRLHYTSAIKFSPSRLRAEACCGCCSIGHELKNFFGCCSGCTDCGSNRCAHGDC